MSWKHSNSLENNFCISALEEALTKGKPEIFNTDQGVQYTSEKFINCLEKEKIKISMDSKGRGLDNIFVERLWRRVKYEDIYLQSYETPRDIALGLKKYFTYYNNERLHQSLGYLTPADVYQASE